MSYQRGSTLRGPAIITLGGQHIRTKGDVKVNVGISTFDIPSSEFPKLDERMQEVAITLEFEPVGQVSAGLLPVLFAPLALVPGDSLFGAADVPVVVTPVTGAEPLTLHCCAVTKMPDVIISATKTTLGSMTITAILANGKEWSDVAARLTTAPTGTVPDVGALDPVSVPTNAARIKWGTVAPWSTLLSREGVVVSFDLQTDPDTVDEFGIVDMAHAGLTAAAKLTPMGCNVQQALAKLAVQGAGVKRGASMAARAMELTAESAGAGGLKVVIPTAALKTAPLIYGRTSPRFADFDFVSLPTTGVVATVSIVPEP